MPVLSREAATAAAANPEFQRRVRAAMLDVAVDVHGGPSSYTQPQYDARIELAAAVCKSPDGYSEVFASVITANEWTPQVGGHVVPGAGDGTDPLVEDANGDAAVRAGVEYAWDTVAATPDIVT